MVNVVTVAAYRQRIYWLKLIGLVQRSAATWRSCYIQSNGLDELLQWLCHVDSTINIGIAIIAIITYLLSAIVTKVAAVAEMSAICIKIKVVY